MRAGNESGKQGLNKTLSRNRRAWQQRAILFVAAIMPLALLSGCAGKLNGVKPAQASIQFTPSNLNFGNVVVGKKVSQTVSIKNTGTTTLNIAEADFSGKQFTFSGITFPFSLPSGSTANLIVSFSGTSTGPVKATLSLKTDAGAFSGPVALAANATPAQAQLSVNPASVGFGSVTMGTKDSASLTLTNTGGSDLNISMMSVNGAPFGVSGITTPKTISAGQSATVSVSFSPTNTGADSGDISISSNDPQSPTTISLTGTGTASPVGKLTLNPSSLAFGNVTVGSNRILSSTVTNSGQATVHVLQVNTSGSGVSTTGLTAGTAVATGQSAVLQVRYAPTGVAALSGSVTIVSDGSGSPTLLSLTGAGVSNTSPSVSISSPGAGATLSGTVSVTASASGTAGVANVQFQLDGTNVGAPDVSSPYTFSWDTTKSSNGNHTLAAVVTDMANNQATSSSVSVTVKNGSPDTTPPTVSITAPVSGSTVSGTIAVSANAADNVGVTSVQFLIDGNITGSPDTAAPYTYSWNTAVYTNGTHTVTAVAKDAAGNSATSAGMTVNVSNAAPLPGQSVLATLAKAMAPGTWVSISTTGFNNGAVLRPPAGGSSLEFNDKQTWNPVAKTVMVLGYSHPGSFSQCGIAVFAQLSDATNTWTNLPSSCPNPENIGGVSHGYEHNTVNPNTGDLYHRQYNSKNFYVFSQSTQTWSTIASPPMSSVQVAGALEYFPDRNSLLFVDGDWGVWEYTFSGSGPSGTWAQRASTNGGGFSPQLTGLGPYQEQSHYSSLCKCIVLGGGGTTTMYQYSASGVFTKKGAAPMNLNIPADVFTADPVSGLILVWDGATNGTAWQYNPVTDTWTQTGISSPIFPGPEGGVTETAAVPIADYGVIMFVQSGSSAGGAVYLYKHTTGAPAGAAGNPLTISSGSASSITTTSALIGWTTSAPADSQVDYGTTTNYGQSTTLAATTVTNHSVALTNLSPATLYHYRVKSHDSSGNLITSADSSFVTSSGVASTPPAVSLTSVVSGATLSGTVTVSASASSSVGIAGVQFQLDTANLGASLTSSPYSINWDTTTASNGAHVLTAVAQDTAGNSATSIAAAVTISNSTVPASTADFQTRCSSPGVLRCIGFDSPSDITGIWGDNTGVFPGTALPALDATVKASGNSSLKFTIPSLSGANSSGSYFANFTPDLSTQFGENSGFYIQWRQRFSPEFLTSPYQGGEGWKQTIIGTGDVPGCTPGSGTPACSTSCSDLEIVTLNNSQRDFPQMYQSCTGSTSHGPYDPFEQLFNSDDFKLQNAMPAPYCLYSQGHTSPKTYFPPNGNCFAYFPDEWMTFQIYVQTGPRVNDEFTNSFVQLWVAREGQPSQLVINWGPYNLSAGSATANQQYGKVWLLPYNTGKDATVSYPTAYTWFDELIVSTQKIPDPK
jgi:hypothetical protein